ncbi:MAG: rod shape-determining protein [Parcubacteria group bacterium]|nr:rod shape-determining protein [Parcubacteria group bacterium]
MIVRKIGIDLGTANTLVFIPKQGVIINEPSIVAVSHPENRVLAIGVEAKKMLGRTPESITTHRPLKDGVIADYRVTQAMLRYFINKATGPWKIFRPEVIISSPAGSTSTERKAVIDAAREAGARNAFVVKEPILAAIGAGIPINSPAGNMIVNLGGGTCEVAVISLGGIVSWASLRIAGDRMDQAIADWLKKKYNLAVGEKTAEELKIAIGSAIPLPEKERLTMEVRGQDVLEGLPKNVLITSDDIAEAIQTPLREIVQTIKTVLRETPPELAADVMDRGMILSGGGAMLRNIDELFLRATGVPAYVADEPALCVAKGTGIVLDNLEVYKRAVLTHR